MMFEMFAGKKIVESIPWKLLIFALAALALVAGAWFTIRAYNGAIRDTQVAKQKLEAVQSELVQERAKSVRLQRDIMDLQIFYSAREARQQQANNRRSQVLARKEKLDDAGHIAIDDTTLLDLNRLFSGDQDGDDTANHSGASGLPEIVTGQVHPGG